MKQMKRLLCLAIAALLVLSFTVTAVAADKKYTITLYAGDKGTFTDGSTVKTFVKSYGETVTLYSGPDDIVLKEGNEKYYVRGVRQSGHEELSATAIIVTKDMDYVVAYGVKGSEVAYTVSFVEYQTGRVLAPSRIYYGNVGDKPVVAYQHIDDYRPRTLNITGTLKENAAANVFTFEYISTVTPTPTPAGGANGNGDNNGGNNAGDNNGGNAPAENGENGGNGDNNGETAPAENVPGTEFPTEPTEIIDIDEAEAPVAEFPVDGNEQGAPDAPAKSNTTLVVAGSVGGVAAVGGLLWYFVLRRRKRRDDV